MPLHDWSTQDDEVFHDFHCRWTAYLTDAMNADRLPGDLFARCEAGLKVEGSDGSDEEPVHRIPDIDVIRDPMDDLPGTAVAVAEAPPTAARTLVLTEQLKRLRRVAVRKGDGELVAMIEIVSRSNLASSQARSDFADKCVRLLSAGVHVVLLDLHPRRGRLLSVEELIARDYGFEDPAVRGEGQSLVTSVQAAPEPVAYFDPLRPGDRLPDSPLFIDAERYVPLPLEETYTETFERSPRKLKAAMAA